MGRSTVSRRVREFIGVALFGAAVIWIISLASYDPTDPVWFFSTGAQGDPANFAGRTAGIRVGEFLYPEHFRQRLRTVVPRKNLILGALAADATKFDADALADEYLGERDGVEQLSAEELAIRLERGDVVVLDVRPETEFRAGHIAGARSMPVEVLDALVDELPKRREVVAYCRGPYCVYADDAVRLLRSRGRKARRLDVGYPEWQRAGLPVESAG